MNEINAVWKTVAPAPRLARALMWLRRHVLRQKHGTWTHANGEPVRPGDWVEWSLGFIRYRGRVFNIRERTVVDVVIAPPNHPSCRCTMSPVPSGPCVECGKVTPGTFRDAFLCPDCAYKQAQAFAARQEVEAAPTVRKPPGEH